ncbi:tRNA (N6-threonylcarbamoyladenosine(37)-N6)-methyltransferase TrmO [Solidesulfovibrio sp.]|jgi:tRNA-Thr(GGU) m(6)t(6)A37 methyltransferase TsaA|uniref:tRNA (N6-threonylcarbamoyladenosine(37)-N6)-methyltransferase TrmO n=1 Tax=Solidesulfovibrio sp. TaxID=2910990 RepID=UPI002B21F3BA|nr:tRNA (N6-threonylcarbamoyladenosine(37)-N6)-methyltransferase TrmO [Solidesulfovibrio sp.]MEA5090662.1 tRNA (N6-threonylcarbamoyladenosine(37)-N6)-methyltransferase TrmO [Solidesulfovibrio sp.]
MDLTLRVLGVVRSPLTDPATAPRFETENAPRAEVVLDPAYRTAAKSLEAGQEVLLFTWFHLADRDCQEVHPRREGNRPLTGVFSTRSPDRPNPIGLHQVRIAAIDGDVLTIEALEAVDGTPVIDIKPLADRHGR